MNTVTVGSLDIVLNDEEFTILPQKAIFYKKEKALIIADVHLGKAGHFRQAGLAVPAGLAYADLQILDGLLGRSGLVIERIIVLGDLFHATLNPDWRIFEEWRKLNSDPEIILIKGNHDILSDSHYEELDIKVSEIMVLNNFMLIHNFEDEEEIGGLYKLCGHIHPAVRMQGKAKQALTLSCFYFNESIGILPAFGRFTGKHIINPSESDNVFVISGSGEGDKVIRI